MRVTEIDTSQYRQPDYPIAPIFTQRWSPRAMSAESLSEDELMTLFEAARWAPSSYNNQPWRFLYATRNSADWRRFFNLMAEGNQSWTKNAAVLMVVVSRKTFERNDKPSPTHSFDTGSAWMSLALQASHMGLVAHGMQGFDYERARQDLNVPDEFQVEAMIAVGKPGHKEDLDDALRVKEQPSTRRPLREIALPGGFKK